MHDTHSTPCSHKQPLILFVYVVVKHWTLVSVLVLSLHLSSSLANASETDDHPTAGSLKLHHPDGDIEAIQLDADMNLHVTGLLAELTLSQTFQNTTNEWVEASYLFPLHEESAVQGLNMLIGERKIVAQIMPTAEANATYEKAKRAGQIASLVEQHRPNLFTMKATSIAPNDIVKVQLSIILPVQVVDKKMQMRLPTTLTPRYSNANTPNPATIDSTFTQQSVSRGPQISISATFETRENRSAVSSQTHELQHTEQGFTIRSVPMDRDLVFEWPMATTDFTTSQAYVSTHNGDRYAQIIVTPPARTNSIENTARELLLVIDKSGSMAGVSMDAARQALHFAIDGLKHHDRFNIVAFDDEYYPLFDRSKKVSDRTTQQARRFIDSLVADGGTEMQSALEFALNTESDNRMDIADTANVPTLRQVVFLTDGSVGYEESLLNTIQQQLGRSRLFTIGIGPAPNSWFIKKAAQIGRGTSLEIQNSYDVAEAVNQLLGKLESPVLTDITVQYPEGYGEIYPSHLPDLYADRPGLWVSRISDDVNSIIVTGTQNGQRIRQTLAIVDPLADDVQPTQTDRHSPAVAIHWARKKISSLLDEQRYSHDTQLHKDTVTALAMDIGLVSPYTSFLAIDTTHSKPAASTQNTHTVANLIPAGNTMMAVVLPQGSAGADSFMVLSLLSALLGIILLKLSRNTAGAKRRSSPLRNHLQPLA